MLENQQVIHEIVAHETFNDELSSPEAQPFKNSEDILKKNCTATVSDDERYWFMKSFILLHCW